jgi:16S rRNA G966 N2-methylase RsmD
MIEIKEEFKKLIPALTAEEFKQLEENILKDGIRDPLVLWNGYLIDGHNRYQIAFKHGLEYKTIDKEFDSELGVKIWMVKNQFGRRNLQDFVKGELITTLEDLEKQKGKEKQLQTLKQGVDIPVLSIIDKTEKHNTQKIVAEKLGWSTGKKAQFDVVVKKAPEEIKAQLRTGEVSINQVYQDIKKEEKQIEKQIKIDAIKEKANDFKNNDIVIHNIDFRELKINSGEIDLILTDPPYPAEFLHLWKDLFVIAKRVLKPNGFLIAYSGQMYLDKIFQFANEVGLDYYWMINIEFTKKPLVHGRKVLNEWKPILVFQNGLKQHDRVFSDKIKMNYTDREMHDLNWGQTVEPFEFLLDRFSNEMDLIFEPFAGTGTTLVACKNKKRKCIATEINEGYIDLIKGRLI